MNKDIEKCQPDDVEKRTSQSINKVSRVNPLRNMNIYTSWDVEIFCRMCGNVDLILTKKKRYKVNKVSRVNPLGDMNLCKEFHGNPSNNWWKYSDIKKKHVNIVVHVPQKQVVGSSKSERFILQRMWMSVQSFNSDNSVWTWTVLLTWWKQVLNFNMEGTWMLCWTECSSCDNEHVMVSHDRAI